MKSVIKSWCFVGLVALCGCGAGPGWLGTGLLVEAILDPSEAPEQGLDCYDLNANGECDGLEDWNGPDGEADGTCDAYDCQGMDGQDGIDGSDGADGDRGIPGPQGEPGETTVIVVDDESDGPPFGRALGHHRHDR